MFFQFEYLFVRIGFLISERGLRVGPSIHIASQLESPIKRLVQYRVQLVLLGTAADIRCRERSWETAKLRIVMLLLPMDLNQEIICLSGLLAQLVSLLDKLVLFGGKQFFIPLDNLV